MSDKTEPTGTISTGLNIRPIPTGCEILDGFVESLGKEGIIQHAQVSFDPSTPFKVRAIFDAIVKQGRIRVEAEICTTKSEHKEEPRQLPCPLEHKDPEKSCPYCLRIQQIEMGKPYEDTIR